MGRLAFSTLGCPDWSFETIVEQAKNLGYCAIELRGVKDELRIEKLPLFTSDNLQATKRLLDKNGLYICGAGTSVSFHDKSNVLQALEEGRAAIDTCCAAGIPAIRVFGDAIPPDEDKNAVFDRIASGFKELCKYSEENAEGAVQIWMEVHGQFNKPETLSPIAERLSDCALFGMIWDIQHTHRAGVDPEDFYREFKPLIRHTHFKDYRYEEDKLILTFPGEGILPIKVHYDVLENNGYTGLYSFEWEKRWITDLPEPELSFPKYVELMNSFGCK
ncbi:MAG: sugar phosphate isomerase/epimerase [Oscillospiraceae bacterium]|nr:sugar phosphate isomerase/epimerase [Oscillospiraceae bacterium]